MPRTEVLKGVPAGKVDEVVQDYESEGATVTKTKENGSYTVTAVFSDEKT